MSTSYQALAGALLLYCTQVQANVFGDGDPGNGVEDGRQGLNSPAAPGRPTDSWRYSAGIIRCDGQIRGSAMILDVSHFADEVTGTFLATAAHVLVDLDRGRRFKACVFHFLGLSQVRGSRAEIDPEWIRAGSFDPGADSRSPAFGRHDWAFIYLPPSGQEVPPGGRILPASFEDIRRRGGVPGEYLLVAYDRSKGTLGVSATCQAIHSTPDDLGGGAWRGQLLDDCDSGDGASGGGLVRVSGEGHYLVGIRSGAHWSPDVYPESRFPSGPPPGAPWDVRHNTNFARAIDQRMLNALRDLVSEAVTFSMNLSTSSE